MASKVPKFGAWENGDVGYTVCFETARKGNKPGGPIINPNDIQMNQEASQAAPPPPNHTKPKPKQQPPPKFGAWEGGDEVPYTQFFENKSKTNHNEPQVNRDVGPTRQPKAPPKQQQQQQPPKFGAWEGGDEVPYTQFFDNKGKTNPSEPQMNRDVGPTRQPKAPPKAIDLTNPKPQGVRFAGGGEPSINNNHKRPPAPRAAPNPGRGPSVPAFGDWNNNPGQAGGYTVVFNQLHEDKKQGNNVPTVNNPPAPNRHTPTHPIKQPKQGCCFSRLFW